MRRQTVPREDGRVVIYYTFDDEGQTPAEPEIPKPASTAQPSATDSDIVLEEER